MTRTAVDMGLLEESVIMEQMVSMKRAGADMIITYFAKDICRMLDEGMK
jgi:porphobilinogen synthase